MVQTALHSALVTPRQTQNVSLVLPPGLEHSLGAFVGLLLNSSEQPGTLSGKASMGLLHCKGPGDAGAVSQHALSGLNMGEWDRGEMENWPGRLRPTTVTISGPSRNLLPQIPSPWCLPLPEPLPPSLVSPAGPDHEESPE